MCHNLRYGGRGPPATVLTTPACCSVNSIAVKKPDIGSESRFLPTQPAFDAPFRGFPSEYCYAVWLGKTRMVWLPDGEKILMICLFVLTEFTNMTDTTHTDTAWRHRPLLHSITRQKLRFSTNISLSQKYMCTRAIQWNTNRVLHTPYSRVSFWWPWVTWRNIQWHDASRGPSATAKLLVPYSVINVVLSVTEVWWCRNMRRDAVNIFERVTQYCEWRRLPTLTLTLWFDEKRVAYRRLQWKRWIYLSSCASYDNTSD